jgi:hypothetical protein
MIGGVNPAFPLRDALVEVGSASQVATCARHSTQWAHGENPAAGVVADTRNQLVQKKSAYTPN